MSGPAGWTGGDSQMHRVDNRLRALARTAFGERSLCYCKVGPLSSPHSLAPRMPIDKKTILFRFPQHWPDKLEAILTLPMCDPSDFMASQNPSDQDLEDGGFDDTLVDPENTSVAPTQRMKTFVKTASSRRVLPCDGSAVDDVKTASFRRALPCDGSSVDDVKTASFRRVLP